MDPRSSTLVSNARRTPRPQRHRTIALAVALLAIAFRSDAYAALSATAGFDRFASSDGARTDALVGVAALSIARGDVLAGAMRLDGDAGDGLAWIAGGGAALGGPVQIRILATFVSGPEPARRLQVGPRFTAASGAGASLAYTRDEIGEAPVLQGALLETSIPLVHTLAARGALGWAASTGGAHGARGSAGLVWSARKHLELHVDLGFAQSAIAATNDPLPGVGGDRAPSGGVLPFAGFLPAARPDAESGATTMTTLFGVRIPFP